MNDLDSVLTGPNKARVEIIPLIDVIFFLLATFVLFTLSLHRVRVFDPELPESTLEQKRTIDETTAFIHVSANGALHWKVGVNGASETVTVAEIWPKLENYKRDVVVPRVLVRSDGKAKLGAAVAVLDEVNRAKIEHVAIETRTSEPGN